MMVRDCALDSGTLTTDTGKLIIIEIIDRNKSHLQSWLECRTVVASISTTNMFKAVSKAASMTHATHHTPLCHNSVTFL